MVSILFAGVVLSGSVLCGEFQAQPRTARPPTASAAASPWKKLDARFDAERLIVRCEAEPHVPIEMELHPSGSQSGFYTDAIEQLGFRRPDQTLKLVSIRLAGDLRQVAIAEKERDPKDLLNIRAHGWIASDLLESKMLRIDYDRREILLANSRLGPEGDAVRLAARIDRGAWRVKVQVVGGDGSAIELDAALAPELPHPLLMGRDGMAKLLRTAADNSDIPVLKIGTFKLRNIPVTSVDQRLSSDNPPDIIIGHRILEQFTVTFDWQGSCMHLSPNSCFGHDCRHALLGMKIRTKMTDVEPGEQMWIISEVLPDSPAGRAGFQAEDRIAHIEGLAEDSWTFNSMYDWLWRHIDKPLKFDVMRGEQKMELSLTPVRRER